MIWGGALATAGARGGLGSTPACTSCVRDRLSGSAVIAPVPRAAAGLYGRHGAFRRSARSTRRDALASAARFRARCCCSPSAISSRCRSFTSWLAYMGADTRDSPPFRGIGRWDGERTCGTPPECGSAPAPGRARRVSALMIMVRYGPSRRAQRRADTQNDCFGAGGYRWLKPSRLSGAAMSWRPPTSAPAIVLPFSGGCRPCGPRKTPG